VPTEEELKRYYEVVWKSKNFQDMMIVKTLMYTGIRVSELINIRLADIDFHYCQVKKKHAVYLFESSWKKKYTDRGIRKILSKYSEEAGLVHNLSPHKLRHFLLTWLKKQGIDDALIQPYSGHESRKSLEIYSKLAITDAQQEYNEVINKFPI
jgi:integrase/recombinase XerD